MWRANVRGNPPGRCHVHHSVCNPIARLNIFCASIGQRDHPAYRQASHRGQISQLGTESWQRPPLKRARTACILPRRARRESYFCPDGIFLPSRFEGEQAVSHQIRIMSTSRGSPLAAGCLFSRCTLLALQARFSGRRAATLSSNHQLPPLEPKGGEA